MKGLLKHELKNMLSPYYLLYLVILTVFRLVQEAKPVYAAVYSLSFLLIVRLAGDNMKADEENGWLAMQGILPVTKGQYLLAKYFRYGVICGGHSLYVVLLTAIRLAIQGDLTVEGFWLPLPATLAGFSVIFALFPSLRFAGNGRGEWRILINLGLTVSILGSLALIGVILARPELTVPLFPVGLCLLAVAAVSCTADVKRKLKQFENYQLGIPSELQL